MEYVILASRSFHLIYLHKSFASLQFIWQIMDACNFISEIHWYRKVFGSNLIMYVVYYWNGLLVTEIKVDLGLPCYKIMMLMYKYCYRRIFFCWEITFCDFYTCVCWLAKIAGFSCFSNLVSCFLIIQRVMNAAGKFVRI